MTRSEAHAMLLHAFDHLGLHYADCASFRSRGMYLPSLQERIEAVMARYGFNYTCHKQIATEIMAEIEKESR